MCVHTKGKNEDRLLVVGAIRSGKWSATDDLEATHTVIDTRALGPQKKEKKKSNEIENECAGFEESGTDGFSFVGAMIADVDGVPLPGVA